MLLPDLHTDFSRGRSGYFFNDIQLNAILVGFNFVSYYLSSLCSYNSITYIFMVYFMYIHIWKVKVLVAQLCPTLCYPRDSSLLDSFVHGILQARILKWVAISFSWEPSWSRNWTCVSYCRWILYLLSNQGTLLLSEYVILNPIIS